MFLQIDSHYKQGLCATQAFHDPHDIPILSPLHPILNIKPPKTRENHNFVSHGLCIFIRHSSHILVGDVSPLSNYIWNISMRWYHRRKFRSETSDNMDSWKAEVRRVRREKIRRKKMQMREKVGKSRFTVCFPMICGSGGSKSRLSKAAGAGPAGQMRDEKVHAVVARSTFRSQNVQNTPMSDHFWKLRCRKSARRCGAKHICKSKCTKHTILGALLEVEMSKKCTPLWREAHFQVKMYKTHHSRTTFGSWDVEKVHAVVARSTFGSENVQNTPCSDHFWRLRCRVSKKCTPLWREAHFQVKMYKTHHVRTTFGGWDVEFRKSARCCGAKHISKSKV